MRTIEFFKTSTGKSPVDEFLESLSTKEAEKVFWVLRLVAELTLIPAEYFKKLKNTDRIWEVRAAHGNNEFRLLGFFDNGNLVVLTNGFAKKSQKTPLEQIALAEQRKSEYLRRKNNG
ncbi:MAG: type II toxin-antitoxin system RelE/ParE family toxin [Chlorobaculum sp.]|jgi:phage-related protein|nr:type II toxin-antitoxin system RelE/ParE family toxin [Chlorobaculum sp.]